MYTKKILDQKEILSESNLHKAVLQQLGNCMFEDASKEVRYIDEQNLNTMIEKWKKDIQCQSDNLLKNTYNLLEDLPHGCLYDRLNETSWKMAAQISELFRNPKISKNSGRLDTKKLQKNIHEVLTQQDSFDIAIGWGQPKRMAGGLKTLGPYADLAEMYAIANLYIIVETIHKITKRTVTLTVLTGGTRFFEAFFTRPELTRQYDYQRQKISDALMSGQNIIKFVPYSSVVGGNSHSAIAGEREVLFKEVLSNVTNEMVAAKFDTILLNVDWNNLFDPSPASRYQSPHGINLPASVVQWLEERKDFLSCNQLIRASINSLIINRHQTEWSAQFENEEVLEDAISFIQNVAWESTRKYIALHIMDSNDESASVINLSGRKTLRLTVHEKRDEMDKPAIYTLGPSGGNQLSQHVLLGCLQSKDIIFESYAEFNIGNNVFPIQLKSGESYLLFDWLVGSQQPLCMVEPGVIPTEELINEALNNMHN